MSTGLPGPGCCGWDPAFAALTAQATANDQAIQADIARLAVQNAQGFGADIAATQAAANAISDKVSYGVETALKSACHTDEEVAEGFGDIKSKMESVLYNLSKQVGDGNAIAQVALTGGFKDQLRDGAVNTAAIQVALVAGFKDSIIDSAKNAAASALAACQNTAAIQASIAASAAAAALAAATNTAAILAAQAECCCELKELVKGESAATRALLDTNEKARLTAALTEAKLEIALSKQCCDRDRDRERRPG